MTLHMESRIGKFMDVGHKLLGLIIWRRITYVFDQVCVFGVVLLHSAIFIAKNTVVDWINGRIALILGTFPQAHMFLSIV